MVFGGAVCAEILPGNISAPATSANRSGRIGTLIDRYPAPFTTWSGALAAHKAARVSPYTVEVMADRLSLWEWIKPRGARVRVAYEI